LLLICIIPSFLLSIIFLSVQYYLLQNSSILKVVLHSFILCVISFNLLKIISSILLEFFNFKYETQLICSQVRSKLQGIASIVVSLQK
jgi:hypothetical protein